MEESEFVTWLDQGNIPTLYIFYLFYFPTHFHRRQHSGQYRCRADHRGLSW